MGCPPSLPPRAGWPVADRDHPACDRSGKAAWETMVARRKPTMMRPLSRIKRAARRHVLCLLVPLLGAALAAPAHAAPAAEPAPVQDPAAPAAPSQPAPYEGQLIRLSELLGALHYLRGLCAAPEAGQWRDKMYGLLEGESADTDRKERMAGAFNKGYRTFQQTYRTCTPATEAVIRTYLDEGKRISSEITARYAN